MTTDARLERIRQAMGAAHVFCTAMNDFLERSLAESGGEPLAMSQVKLMLLISHPDQSFKVTDIADFLGVTNAAASRAIERLVQRGMVDRGVSQEDRRAVTLDLTERGAELMKRFNEVRNASLLELLDGYPDSDLKKVADLLDRLSVRLLDQATDPGGRCLRCGVHFRGGCVLRDVLGRECVVAGGLYGDADAAD